LRSAAPDGSAAPPLIDPARVQPPPAALAPQEPPKPEISRWVIGIGVGVLALILLLVPVVYFIVKDPTPRYTPEPVHDVTYWYTAIGGARVLDLQITYTGADGDEMDFTSSLTPVWRKDTRTSGVVDVLSLAVLPKGLDGKQDVTQGPIPPQFTITCGIDIDGRSAVVKQHATACFADVFLPAKTLGPSAMAPTTGP
jgi:hypothetical protein